MYNRFNSEKPLPVVMSFSASDPSGGAGIQADIETIGSLGGHCAPIITSITARDTTDLYQFYPCPARLVQTQAKAVLEDMPIAAFKIGILGSIENIRIVHNILIDYPDIPVVLDPAARIGTKAKSLDPNLLEMIIDLILPRVTICTPNVTEARLMAPEADTLDACAQEIMAEGADYVLITGNLQTPNKMTNTLYGNYRRIDAFESERLKIHFQGAGCTLSAAITLYLAQGLPVPSAVFQAQEYTLECLKQACRIGMGQHLPNRFFWATEACLDFTNNQETPYKKILD